MKTLTKWLYISIGAVFVVFLYFFLNSQYFLNLEYSLKDFVLKRNVDAFSSRLPVSEESIVFVDIDEESLSAYHKSWPLDRKAIALITRRLKDAKAIIFSIPIEGATGTSGDDALERVFRMQHNIFIPIRFKEVYPPVGGIATAESAVILPWRKAVPYVFVGVLNFYKNILGDVDGFYPIIGYKGQILSHLSLKVLSFLKGFDDKTFVFSKKSKSLEWTLPSGSKFRLPVDYYKGVSINFSPYQQEQNAIPSVSFKEILPVQLYKKYKNRGISVSPYNGAEGKIFIIGATAPSISEKMKTPIGPMPLGHILGYSLKAVLQGSLLKSYPVFMQYMLLLLALGLLLFSFLSAKWAIRLLVLAGEYIAYIFAFYFLLTHHGVFIFVFRPLLAITAVFPVLFLLEKYHTRLSLHKKELEVGIITEIKEKTTFLPPSDLPWLDTRIKEVRADRISGGMYDFVPMDNKHIAIAVADVFSSGKDALLKISYLRGFLKSQTTITRQPGEVVYSINKALVKNNSLNMTCRFLYLLLDAVKNKIIYSGAGGVSFIVLGAEGTSVRCFEAEERILLGISREIFYEPREVNLKKGDTVIIYTPNIFSMKNKNGRSYDVDRLGRLILGNHKLPAGALIERLSRDIKSFIGKENLQDFALIAVKWVNEPLVEGEENIYVGISRKERDMLLFFKGKKKGK